jgi:hypothetical protein
VTVGSEGPQPARMATASIRGMNLFTSVLLVFS